MRKICAYDSSRTFPCLAPEREGHVTRTAAKIENVRIRLRQYIAERVRSSTPPHAVNVEGQNMI
jgi:hypothetical protein